MKKHLPLLLLGLVLLSITVWAATAGSSGDPLASLSYLQRTFSPAVNEAVEERLDQSDALLLEQIAEHGTLSAQVAATWQEACLKSGDVLNGSTGTNVLLLAGKVRLTYTGSAVVDVTAGETIPSDSDLLPEHRYLVAEDTSAQFIVTSKSAALDYQGPFSFSYSDAIDYYAIARALKAVNLLRGSDTGYAEGFDLEVTPTRLQALIMLIRLLGEEDAALASPGTCRFLDVKNYTYGAYYVDYAYKHGYTNGCTPTEFRPNDPVNVNQYTEFVLRAMKYSSTAQSNISDALARAKVSGIITDGEASMLGSDPFRRAELIYLSYISLFAQMPDSSQTLADTLIEKGVFTAETLLNAQKTVSQNRP